VDTHELRYPKAGAINPGTEKSEKAEEKVGCWFKKQQAELKAG
jgi:hypothetical protein